MSQVKSISERDDRVVGTGFSTSDRPICGKASCFCWESTAAHVIEIADSFAPRERNPRLDRLHLQQSSAAHLCMTYLYLMRLESEKDTWESLARGS